MEGPGFSCLRLAHFYRTVGWLWRRKERIERHLYDRDRDLFNEGLDLVFFDTTSTYFDGRGWEGWAKLGKTRDHRPDHLQLILGVVMRRDGVPITCEIWPGNLQDTKTLLPILEGLKKRFRIGKVVLVCDRGMVSARNLKAIRQARYDYIVGMKMRGLLEVRERVLKRAGRYREVKHILEAKQVWVEDRRYVVCFNPERVEKDRRDRQAILDKLAAKLAAGGVKRLITNRGYRRFLKVTRGAAQIDAARVKEDERYDGKYVLRTTTDLRAAEVGEAYKQTHLDRTALARTEGRHGSPTHLPLAEEGECEGTYLRELSGPLLERHAATPTRREAAQGAPGGSFTDSQPGTRASAPPLGEAARGSRASPRRHRAAGRSALPDAHRTEGTRQRGLSCRGPLSPTPGPVAYPLAAKNLVVKRSGPQLSACGSST